MHELLHILGLCGEKHPSLLIIINEWFHIQNVINYYFKK